MGPALPEAMPSEECPHASYISTVSSGKARALGKEPHCRAVTVCSFSSYHRPPIPQAPSCSCVWHVASRLCAALFELFLLAELGLHCRLWPSLVQWAGAPLWLRAAASCHRRRLCCAGLRSCSMWNLPRPGTDLFRWTCSGRQTLHRQASREAASVLLYVPVPLSGVSHFPASYQISVRFIKSEMPLISMMYHYLCHQGKEILPGRRRHATVCKMHPSF